MVFFSVTHWLFAFEYYKVSTIMPYVFDEQNLPEVLLDKLEKLKKVILWLNIFFTGVSGPLYAIYYAQQVINDEYNSGLVYILLIIDMICYGILFFVTFVFLLIAVYRISKFIRKNRGKVSQLNKTSLILHATSFCFFLLSEQVSVIATIWPRNLNSFTDWDFYAIIALIIFSFISELILAIILYQLALNKDLVEILEQREKENIAFPEVEVVDFDSHAELQARIWN